MQPETVGDGPIIIEGLGIFYFYPSIYLQDSIDSDLWDNLFKAIAEDLDKCIAGGMEAIKNSPEYTVEEPSQFLHVYSAGKGYDDSYLCDGVRVGNIYYMSVMKAVFKNLGALDTGPFAGKEVLFPVPLGVPGNDKFSGQSFLDNFIKNKEKIGGGFKWREI